MASNTIKLPISRVTRRITMSVKITGFRSWGFRLWVGTRLIKLACFIVGCKTEIEVK